MPISTSETLMDGHPWLWLLRTGMPVAKNGHLDAVELLLDGGADISAKDHNGRIALNLAIENKHDGVKRFLVAEMTRTVCDKSNAPSLHRLTPSCIYAPMENPRQTKIPVIQPGSFSNPIHCELGTVSFKSI
jgi:hypothetical protein